MTSVRRCEAFVRPFRLALGPGAFAPARDGLWLRLSLDDGAVGWGEAAPLPGFSRESPDEARQALDNIAGRVPGAGFDEGDPLGWAGALAAEAPSSVRFAVESAAVHLASALRGQSAAAVLAAALGTEARTSVSCAALVTGAPETWTARVHEAVAAGYGVVKLKVGRADSGAESRALEALAAAVRGLPVRLRLDANRAFSFDDALRLADAARALPVEFLEEPLAEPARLAEFAAAVGLPVALDESLQQGDPGEVGFAAALVLKPTLVGGIARCMDLARRAEAAGAAAMVSSAFETGVGLRMAAALACALPGRTLAAGLDTARWFDEDGTTPRFDVSPHLAAPSPAWHVRAEAAP